MAPTYRIRGIPLDWDDHRVSTFLATAGHTEAPFVHSLARELHGRSQSATVSFQDGFSPSHPQMRLPAPTRSSRPQVITIDHDFHGITTLYTPPAEYHKVDVVALSGLGGHAFGSFKQRGEEHMWIRDSLPYDLVEEDGQASGIGRVMIYGYESAVVGSTSFENLEDFAISFRDSLLPIINTTDTAAHRPIIFIAHSLGGLVLKQMLILLSKSERDEDLQLLSSVYGVAFFGVPHDGMDIRSLIPMVTDAPNRSLVESLSLVNSQILGILRRDFHQALGKKGESEVVCFFETRESPTAQESPDGTWAMNGPKAVLVTKSSAIHGRHWEDGLEYVCAIGRTHSEMVKFGPEDHEYDKVSQRLRTLARHALLAPRRRVQQEPPADTHTQAGTGPQTYMYIQLAKNNRFTGRTAILDALEGKLFGSNRAQKTALVGLGGVGKTQIALHFAYDTKEKRPEYSIFWVPMLSRQSVTQAYTDMATKLGIQKSNENEDIRELVCQRLSSNEAGKWLVIVDNADDDEIFFGSAQESGIEQFLPESENNLILLTTRSGQVATDFAGPEVIDVEQMTSDEARYLLKQSLIRKELTQDEEVVDSLLAYLSFLPLAITQAAAYLNMTRAPLQQYLDLLQGAGNDLAKVLGREFRDNTRYRGSRNAVGTTWLVSFDQIGKSDPAAVRLLSFMAFIEPRSIPRAMLPHTTPDELEWAIGTLCSYSFLVRQDDNQTFGMHSLVHMAIRAWLEMQKRTEDVIRDATRHLANIFPSDEPINRELWRKYLPHTMRLLYQTAGQRSETTYQLFERAGYCLLTDRRIKESITCFKEVYWWRSRLPKDDPYRLAAEHNLATAYINDRRTTDAIEILEHIVAVRRDTLDKKDHSRLSSEHGLATAYIDDQRTTDAIEILEHVVAVERDILDEKNHSRLSSEHQLASAYIDDQRTTDAIEILEHVVAVRRDTLDKNDHSRLASEHGLATAYLDEGRVADAILLLEHVVGIRKETLDEKDHSRLTSEHNLASAYLEEGRAADAIQILEHVVGIKRETLDEKDRSRVISERLLARAYRELGD